LRSPWAAAANPSASFQNDKANTYHAVDPELLAMKGEAYMSMLDTAEVVAKRYNISRERQDEYGLESQRRTVSAQQAGRFNEELAPITTTMAVVDKATGTTSYQKVTLSFDEGMRSDTTAARGWLRSSLQRGLGSSLPPATPASFPTAPARQ
jgi:acetyl-CoA acetyltransferase